MKEDKATDLAVVEEVIIVGESLPPHFNSLLCSYVERNAFYQS